MNNVERAKQFMPFDALVGLQAALREREERHSRIERKDLAEEEQMEISETISRVVKGCTIDVTFYLNGHYVEVVDKVVKIQTTAKFLQLGTTKIYFDDIYKIEIVESPSDF